MSGVLQLATEDTENTEEKKTEGRNSSEGTLWSSPSLCPLCPLWLQFCHLASRHVLGQRDGVLFLKDVADAVVLQQAAAVGANRIGERAALRVVGREAQLADEVGHQIADRGVAGNTACLAANLPCRVLNAQVQCCRSTHTINLLK